MYSNSSRTLVFCTSFACDAGFWDHRYRRWLDAIKNSAIRHATVAIIDDGSPVVPSWSDCPIIESFKEVTGHKGNLIYRFPNNLGRQSMFNYPGWFRSFASAGTLAKALGLTRIVHVESDAFILSRRFQAFINSVSDGWIAPWAFLKGVPESGIQIIAGSGFNLYETFVADGYDTYRGKIIEKCFPFTSVTRSFDGDRHGEFVEVVPASADWTMQAPPGAYEGDSKYIASLKRNIMDRAPIMRGFSIDVIFENLDAWLEFAGSHPEVFAQARIEESVDLVRSNGAFDPFLGFHDGGLIRIVGTNYRESLIFQTVNSRNRAVLKILAEEVSERGLHMSLYCCEFLTGFAGRLRVLFPNFIGSEFLPDPEHLARESGTPHQDIQKLSFQDATLDMYVNNEVLEHIPDVEAAIQEAARVLKPGGMFVGTFPFAYMQNETVIRSRLIAGQIEHVLPEERHGNPVPGAEGSLVYEVQGWSFLDRCVAAGFQSAQMRFIASAQLAILGAEVAGVFVFVARR